ncbi:MAG TPA: hypothetical protein VJ464_20150 [Blastocatellia bacterium]|nr:hypothetical protein [Blastocatellia bacterium]
MLITAGRLALTVARTASPERGTAQKQGGGGPQLLGGPHQITITPIGPDQATIDRTKNDLLKNSAVTTRLKNTRYRLVNFELIEPDPKASDKTEAPTQYRAQFFDYSNNRAYVATGNVKDASLQLTETKQQPNVSEEEFADAVNLLTRDKQFGAALRTHKLEPYRPMPPLVALDEPVGKVERTITVGLMPADGKQGNEVVGVNLIRQTVVRYAGGAPPTSSATDSNCGLSSAGQATTSSGTAGQYDVVISRNGQEFWRFTCIRPAASSGVNKSGIDLKNVKYRGKLVLKEAHAPILNVQYERNLCGPYRDWSYSESYFDAVGTDVPGTNGGIRICTAPPQTVLDNGTDNGTFRGIAIWDREDVTLVSELEAGWYRYVSKWVFRDSGVIEPRFGFTATTNSCVCHNHVHHVYWRLDFDLNTDINNAAFESRNGLLSPINVEAMLQRVKDEDQSFVVRNLVSGESATIFPGPKDGNYDKYGKGDLWFLKYKSDEIDDGNGIGTSINIAPFVNGESLNSTDLVVWYAGHWVHDHFDIPPSDAEGPEILGPEIVLQGY